MTSDGEAVALIEATLELQTVEILTAHANLSDVALDRVGQALDTIRAALNLKRAVAGLQPYRHAVAA
jgi:hypothetical protein